jgi:hypothetical protein
MLFVNNCIDIYIQKDYHYIGGNMRGKASKGVFTLFTVVLLLLLAINLSGNLVKARGDLYYERRVVEDYLLHLISSGPLVYPGGFDQPGEVGYNTANDIWGTSPGYTYYEILQVEVWPNQETDISAYCNNTPPYYVFGLQSPDLNYYFYEPGSTSPIHFTLQNEQIEEIMNPSNIQPGSIATLYVFYDGTGVNFNGEYWQITWASYTGDAYPSVGGGCVFEYTPILTLNGTYIFAKNIIPGMYIMSYNFTDKQLQPEMVTKVVTHLINILYFINGDLMVDQNHTIWTKRGYVSAKNLTYNDTFYDPISSKFEPVYSIMVLHDNFTVYDFSMKYTKNFIAWNYILYDINGIHSE